jgi:hypothetical protein
VEAGFSPADIRKAKRDRPKERDKRDTANVALRATTRSLAEGRASRAIRKLCLVLGFLPPPHPGWLGANRGEQSVDRYQGPRDMHARYQKTSIIRQTKFESSSPLLHSPV